ncbi:hypothetical protein Tco_0178378 [Tanacetum coccineum]
MTENRLLNGELMKVVYVSPTPEGSVDPEHPSHVYRLKKASLVGLNKLQRRDALCRSHEPHGEVLLVSLISWTSVFVAVIQKQKSNCHLHTEAEYFRPIRFCAQKIPLMRSQLRDYGFAFQQNSDVLVTIKVAIAHAVDSVPHSRSKHIDIRTTSQRAG